MYLWGEHYKQDKIKIYVQNLKNYTLLFFSVLVLSSCSTRGTTTISNQSIFNYSDRVVSISDNEYQLIKVSDDDVPEVGLGQEYSKYNKLKKGGNPISAKNKQSVAEKVLLYLPNRFLDLIDILKIDIGVGPSFGGVLRLTKYGQVGYRTFSPASIRVGLRGRELPVFMENESEFGIGPAFVQSSKRNVGESEVGAGLDLLIVGAYLGIDFIEIADFVTGIFTVDLKGDDL